VQSGKYDQTERKAAPQHSKAMPLASSLGFLRSEPYVVVSSSELP
jgi:hypothetical protein